MKHRLFQKFISSITLLAFLCLDVGNLYAQIAQIPQQKTLSPETPDLQIFIPQGMASVIERYEAPDSKHTVILFQDMHAQYEAQKRTVELLEFLARKYGLRLIHTEAASGPVPTEYFRSFPDKDVLRKVADEYMSLGRLTGAEFAAMNSRQEMEVYGIEDLNLYINNYNIYHDTLSLRKETKAYLTKLRGWLSRLEDYIYSGSAKEFSQLLNEYLEHKISLEEFAPGLVREAQRQGIRMGHPERSEGSSVLDPSLPEASQDDSYAQLQSYREVLDLKKKVDFKKLHEEVAQLLVRVQGKVSEEEMANFLEQTLAYRLNEISPIEFYQTVKKLMQLVRDQSSSSLNNLRLTTDDLRLSYPNIHNYMSYLEADGQVNDIRLFEEVKLLGFKTLLSMCINSEARALCRYTAYIDLVGRVADLDATRAEYKKYLSEKGKWVPRILDFIREQVDFYLPNDERSEDLSYPLTEKLKPIELYYDAVLKRDGKMAQFAIERLKQEESKVSALVTGGFHTEGLLRRLKKSGYSYLVVIPNFDGSIPSRYEDVMNGKKTVLEKWVEENTAFRVLRHKTGGQERSAFSKKGEETTPTTQYAARENSLMPYLMLLSEQVGRPSQKLAFEIHTVAATLKVLYEDFKGPLPRELQTPSAFDRHVRGHWGVESFRDYADSGLDLNKMQVVESAGGLLCRIPLRGFPSLMLKVDPVRFDIKEAQGKIEGLSIVKTASTSLQPSPASILGPEHARKAPWLDWSKLTLGAILFTFIPSIAKGATAAATSTSFLSLAAGSFWVLGLSLTVGALLVRSVYGLYQSFRLKPIKIEILSDAQGLKPGTSSDSSVTWTEVDANHLRLEKDGKALDIERIIHQERTFLRVGYRVYEQLSETATVEVSELLNDPLLWLGNAQLVDFFGEEAATRSMGSQRGPPSLTIVEWTNPLAEGFPSYANVTPQEIEVAHQKLSSQDLHPFLRAHYSLVLYYGEGIAYLEGRQDRISLELLNSVSNLGEEKLDEMLFALLGARNHWVPHITSHQFLTLHHLIRKLQRESGARFISVRMEGAQAQDHASDIVIGRLGSMFLAVSDAEIKSLPFDDLNQRMKERTGYELIFNVDSDTQTITFDFTELGREQRESTRLASVFPKRGPPLSLNRDDAVVGALSQLGKTGSSGIVNSLLKVSKSWRLAWVVTSVLKGIAANYRVKPVLVGSKKSDLGRVFEGKKIGVVRGGFGLGGASKETETWVRDIFSREDMFHRGVEMLSGTYLEGVSFGEKVESHRKINPFVDGYFYKGLAKAIFSQKPLTGKDVVDSVVQMDRIITQFEKLQSGDPSRVGGLDSIEALRRRQEEFFETRGLATLLAQVRSGTPDTIVISEADALRLIQGIYDFCVDETKRAFINWVHQEGLNVLLIGQIALPNENPVVYAGLVAALNEMNQARGEDNKVVAYVRQNYFRPLEKPRNGLQVHAPRKGDPVEIFVESETNAQIFEEIFGFRPSVLYEAVKFFGIDSSEESVQSQMTESTPENLRGHDTEEYLARRNLEAARESFRVRVERTVQDHSLENIVLDGDRLSRDIIILQPSRMDENKRPDSTLWLAKMIQDEENTRARAESRAARRVKVLFLGKLLSAQPGEKPTGISNNEWETHQETTRLASELGLADQIYFVGEVTQLEVLGAMTYADVMSQPSDRETFGRTPMEAISMGVPVIVSRNYVYPYFEDQQVFWPLFGGFRIFAMPQGEMKGQEWQKGETKPAGAMVERILNVLSDTGQIDSVSRFNYLAARRSMMNLKNLENFMRLHLALEFDPHREKIKFVDRPRSEGTSRAVEKPVNNRLDTMKKISASLL